jgi:hypothetical protein
MSYVFQKPTPRVSNPNAYPFPQVRKAAKTMASIHSGVKGLSIPDWVMSFYKAVIQRDDFRPAMMRVIVPTTTKVIIAGKLNYATVERVVQRALMKHAKSLTVHHLNAWMTSDPDREASVSNPSDPNMIRQVYVDEALVYFVLAYERIFQIAANPPLPASQPRKRYATTRNRNGRVSSPGQKKLAPSRKAKTRKKKLSASTPTTGTKQKTP